jgi:hypothetical protein
MNTASVRVDLPSCGACFEQMLAAATTASGTGAVGAATRPLDGRALTHGVDARASEGAGGSAAFLPPSQQGWFPICYCGSKVFWWRNRGRK